MSHIVSTSSIYYDPNPRKTVIVADQELLDTFIENILDEDEWDAQVK